MKDDVKPAHQSTLLPADNKFHLGNGSDGKHYWLTPPDLCAARRGKEFQSTYRASTDDAERKANR